MPSPQAPKGWDEQHPFWAKILDNVILPAYNARPFADLSDYYAHRSQQAADAEMQALRNGEGKLATMAKYGVPRVLDKLAAGALGIRAVETPLLLAPPVAGAYFGTQMVGGMANQLPAAFQGDPNAVEDTSLAGAGIAGMGVGLRRGNLAADQSVRAGNNPGQQPIPFAQDAQRVAREANIAKTAYKVNKLTAQNGGATYNLQQGNLLGRDAFAVAAFPERAFTKEGNASFPSTWRYVRNNYDFLNNNPNTSLGTWQEGGKTYYDIAATPRNLGAARQLGSELNQKAIYDLQFQRDIATGGTGEAPSTLPDVQHRLDLINREAPTARVNHYSNHPNLTEVDPATFGTGNVTGAERKRASEPGFINRGYLGIAGEYREPAIQARPYKYDATVNKSRYYDISGDPEGFWQRATNPTAAEAAVRDAGYSGYGFNGVLASFDKVGLQPSALAPTVAPQPNAFLRSLADSYNREHGLGRLEVPNRVTVDARAPRIAAAYEQMPHNPSDPRVQQSYNALKDDITKQWEFATKNGIQFEPWKQEGQPYANSTEMMRDVQENKRLYYFQGGDIPADHPMAATHPLTGESYNNMFRAVHDLFGHAQSGFQFGASGEEGAWSLHRQMMRPDAVPALTSETRGQNSWVNFGQHLQNAGGRVPAKGEPGYVPPTARPFAQQKAGLLPEEFQQPYGQPKSAPQQSILGQALRSTVQTGAQTLSKNPLVRILGSALFPAKFIVDGPFLPKQWEGYQGNLTLNELRRMPQGREQFQSFMNGMPDVNETAAGMELGRVGQNWWNRSGAAVMKAAELAGQADPNTFRLTPEGRLAPEEARAVLGVHAATSPNQPVQSAFTEGWRGLYGWMAQGRPQTLNEIQNGGFPLVSIPDAKHPNIAAAVTGQSMWDVGPGGQISPFGRKTNFKVPSMDNMMLNSLYADPAYSGYRLPNGFHPDSPVNDTHMQQILGLPEGVVNRGPAYNAATSHLRAAGAKAGMSGGEGQAAIWTLKFALDNLRQEHPNASPQELVSKLSPEIVQAHAQDLADLLRHDTETRQILSDMYGYKRQHFQELDSFIDNYRKTKPRPNAFTQRNLDAVLPLAERLYGSEDTSFSPESFGQEPVQTHGGHAMSLGTTSVEELNRPGIHFEFNAKRGTITHLGKKVDGSNAPNTGVFAYMPDGSLQVRANNSGLSDSQVIQKFSPQMKQVFWKKGRGL